MGAEFLSFWQESQVARVIPLRTGTPFIADWWHALEWHHEVSPEGYTLLRKSF